MALSSGALGGMFPLPATPLTQENDSFRRSVVVRVELHAAKIPSLPGLIADHNWLLVFHDAEGSQHQDCDRWEVWQRANQNTTCWGHLHKNLLAPYQGVGNGPSRLIQQWIDNEALSIVERIESSPLVYPFINQYSYWPGPNSNTFAQWIVRGEAKLGIRAIGKNFPVPDLHLKSAQPCDTCCSERSGG